jgi:3-hydroxyacyl-CoA dehydrogenase/3-hydroxy-2-methylbutyryl-CoA dehydrogenase
MSLASRIALVTGAASGLGRATAERFAKAGARVVIVDLPTSGGDETAKAIGSNAIFAPADVTSPEDVTAALDKAQDAFGAPINAVVQCAGIAPPSKVLGKKGPHDLGLFQKVLTVNTVGTFNVLRLASERMAAGEPVTEDGERGCIINTASIAAFEGQVGQAAYSASKGAVVGLMLPVARELSRQGIRVNTIAPGVFLTPMVEGLPPKVQEELGAIVPFPKRLGHPDMYAHMAESIVTNPYINGEVIRVDGALRMTA